MFLTSDIIYIKYKKCLLGHLEIKIYGPLDWKPGAFIYKLYFYVQKLSFKNNKGAGLNVIREEGKRQG